MIFVVGFVQTIKDEGMPLFEQSTYGDLFVEYVVVLPTQLSADSRRRKFPFQMRLLLY